MRETHGFDSMPLYVRPGTVLARGTRDDRPDYDYLDEVELVVYPGGPDSRTVELHASDGSSDTVTVVSRDGSLTATGASGRAYAVREA